MTERSLSTPNRMVWQYFESLRSLAQALQNAEPGNRQKQGIAVCIFLSVTVVEAFVNLFFRIQIESPEYAAHKARILDDLKRRKSLDYKVQAWPKLLFGREWNLTSSAGKRFLDLKDRRNALMHFTSSHESVAEIPGVLIEGMADTTAFDSLRIEDAALAVQVAEESICSILKVAGYSADAAEKGLHYWTGKVPASFLEASPSPTETRR